MKILFLVSVAILATFVQADMPTADEVSLAKQVRICLDMGNDKSTCLEKFADKIAKFDPVHFNAVVNYEAVLKELNEFLAIYNVEGGHKIRQTLEIMKQKAQASRQKRDMPTADEISLAKQVRICLDMGNDKASCMEKVADKIAKFDPVHFNAVVNYEAVLKELNEFFEFYKQGHNIRESLALLEQKHAAAAGQRQKREAPQAVQTLMLFYYLTGQCVEKNPTMNRVTCAIAMFGPNTENLKEKIDAYLKDKKELLAGFYESSKSKLGDVKDSVQGWFTETFGRNKRDLTSVVGDVTGAAKAQWEKIKACAEQGSNVFSCAYQLYGSKAGEVLSGLKEEINGWIKELKEKLGRTKRDMPTQEQIGWAKAIKICLDMGKDKDSCYDKVLGANKANVDLVFLDTIGKYEDVLKELRQFLDIYNQGGHTIRETLLLLHKQQTAGKNRAITAANVQDLIDLKTVVLECLNALPNKDVTKCAVAVFGTQIQGSSQLQLVQQLINHPQVQEFARGAGQKLHSYMQSLDGFLGQLHGWAHSAYDWVVSLG